MSFDEQSMLKSYSIGAHSKTYNLVCINLFMHKTVQKEIQNTELK